MLRMDHLSDVLTAISHPTRRAIIGQLANGPARFSDVAKPFDTALNAVTKHLKLLERAGLIERRKQGREVFISFRGEPLREVAEWVNDYERFWSERFTAKRNEDFPTLFPTFGQEPWKSRSNGQSPRLRVRFSMRGSIQRSPALSGMSMTS